MKFSKKFFGSELLIDIKNDNIDKTIVEECFLYAEKFENTYSRFIKGNFLYQLNKNKHSDINTDFYSIINLCLNVSKITDGYFDITVLQILENMGYGSINISSTKNIGYKNIKLSKNKIILENDISIEIGSIGKGYVLDKISNILKKHYNKYIINFGGDIICKGKNKIFLEDPNYDNKMIGDIILNNQSISSSSGLKRVFNKNHHLVNPYNKKPINDKISIYIVHDLATFSDIFSTALFVTPLKKGLNILYNTKSLDGLIISKDGSIYKSDGFKVNLY